MAGAQITGASLSDRRIHWATEVTVHDTLQMKEYLPFARAGCRALWLGVEDMTATLVKKGQSVSKTTEVFGRLRDAGICPMPMMVHHDSQPLFSHGSDYGLLPGPQIAQGRGGYPAGLDDDMAGLAHTIRRTFQSVAEKVVSAAGIVAPGKHLVVATLDCWLLQERESQNRLKFRNYVIEALRSYTKD